MLKFFYHICFRSFHSHLFLSFEERFCTDLGSTQLAIGGPSSAYNEIYNTKWDKDSTFYAAFGQGLATFPIPSVAEAKPRKDLFLPFFSRRSILSLENVIQEMVRCQSFKHKHNMLTLTLDRRSSCCTGQAARSRCCYGLKSGLSLLLS